MRVQCGEWLKPGSKLKTKGINYAGSAACTIAPANRVAAGVSVNLERRKTRCVKFRGRSTNRIQEIKFQTVLRM